MRYLSLLFCALTLACVPAQPSLPSPIKVGHLLYRFQYEAEKDVYGSIVYKDEIIRINPGMNRNFERQIVLHEVMHAAGFYALRAHGKGPMTDDEFIEAYSPVLLQTLRDNPQLVQYLLEGTDGQRGNQANPAQAGSPQGK